MPLGVRRVWDGAWFADVPDDGATTRTLDEVVEGEEGAVVLHGIVLHQDDATTVVSCGGLLARVPRRPEHALQSAVRVVVRQRAHAA